MIGSLGRFVWNRGRFENNLGPCYNAEMSEPGWDIVQFVRWLAVIALVLVPTVGPRLFAMTRKPSAATGLPARAPFWPMMFLRVAVVAVLWANFGHGGGDYHGYPEVTGSYGGATIVVTIVVVADAAWDIARRALLILRRPK